MKFKFIIPFLFAGMLSWADNFNFHTYLEKQSRLNFKEAVKIRRHLHQYPELCYQEKKTTEFIAGFLKKLGLEVSENIAGTGLKALLKGKNDEPVVGIRADLDALPITEKTGLSFESKHKGIMHACGHDIHMTNVLITAKMLSKVREKLPGSIVFIFQPCEEGTTDGKPTGARLMVNGGVLKNPKINVMFGLHIMPDFPVGTIALKPGPLMANVDSVFITIYGKSSHGAFPHQGIDAIYASSCAIQQFQSLISRFKDPKEQAVLSIGKICGGVRVNVISERVDMEGTVRTFSFKTQNLIQKGIEKILKGLELSHGITFKFNYAKGTKYVKNNPELTNWAFPIFEKILGKQNVILSDPLTIGEDFATYSHRIPSLFFFLGAGGKGKLHTPILSPDEKIFLFGPRILASLAVEYLMNRQDDF
jgi:amidohydrolase